MSDWTGNLFHDLPAGVAAEELRQLCQLPGCRIERIVSTGQASPPEGWYDQVWTEWVLLLSGAAAILFEDEAEPRELRPGDHLLIRPHRRHRVLRTQASPATVWLAIHVGETA